MVGCKVSIAFDHRDALDADAELLRRHLWDGDAQSLAQVHFAAKNRYRAIASDGDEAIDLARIDRFLNHATTRRNRLRSGELGNAKADDECAAGLEKVAAGAARAHVLILPAARMTARKTRWCEPHRHKLPWSAALASCAVAFGLRASNAALVMTMPLVQ